MPRKDTKEELKNNTNRKCQLVSDFNIVDCLGNRSNVDRANSDNNRKKEQLIEENKKKIKRNNRRNIPESKLNAVALKTVNGRVKRRGLREMFGIEYIGQWHPLLVYIEQLGFHGFFFFFVFWNVLHLGS